LLIFFITTLVAASGSSSTSSSNVYAQNSSSSSPSSEDNVCTPKEQSANVCTAEDLSSSEDNVCTPEEQSDNVCTSDAQLNSENTCNPAVSSKAVHYVKYYNNGIWQFIYSVYNGQGLVLENLFAGKHMLLDTLSVPHFKIDYGGKSKIIRFCNEPTSAPQIYSEINSAKKKYDRLSWQFEKVFDEPDLNGILQIEYDIIVRIDPTKNCEFTENLCYRFIPLVKYVWKSPGYNLPPDPRRLDKITAYYKVDYGNDAGLNIYRDRNINIGNFFQIGPQDFQAKEIKFRAVVNGKQGSYDTIHNAHLGQPLYLPGCRTSDFDCLHMHWRWADMTPDVDPMVDTITDGRIPSHYEGLPYLVPGQTIDVAVVKYNPNEKYTEDPTTLVNGEILSTQKHYISAYPPDRKELEKGQMMTTKLISSSHPVVWIIPSISDTVYGQFFRNGFFVLDTR